MRTILAVIAVSALIGAEPAAREWTFVKSDLGKLPADWKAAKTGMGEGSVWKVAADETAPGKSGHVLMQTAESPSGLFNLCLATGSEFADGELSVHIKAVSGKTDQGGGLVWRVKDANNYYICRFNPLEDNLRVYKVVEGKRTQLATKEEVTVPAGKWFTVSIRHVGNKIECQLNGKKHLEATDDTFLKPGQVGLWSKADAVSAFDQLKLVPIVK
jgi:Domain of Unknown Function (DUF1080)